MAISNLSNSSKAVIKSCDANNNVAWQHQLHCPRVTASDPEVPHWMPHSHTGPHTTGTQQEPNPGVMLRSIICSSYVSGLCLTPRLTCCSLAQLAGCRARASGRQGLGCSHSMYSRDTQRATSKGTTPSFRATFSAQSSSSSTDVIVR